ncbi:MULTISPECIES: aminoglycoside phosphotransferase family protein [unclassified Streptomyces]|uniref:aminoglycoside phosphotransferase family protein n=1 Tax=unclassified Streptomyces TaxID=2593676 RepID=UPI0033D67CD1
MTSESTLSARERAAQVSGGERALVGPLKGYHHETYVFPLPDRPEGPDAPEGGGGSAAAKPTRWKCREPRKNLLWFDRRCFSSEENLVKALAGHISRIPEVIDFGDFGLQKFIEGRTLGSRHAFGDVIPERLIGQIVELFEELTAVDPEKLSVARRCVAKDRPADGDTAGFVERLICFTEEQVYLRNAPRFGGLFRALGIDAQCFGTLRRNVSGLTSRPFGLLHGDLHRENFIVDPDGRLWAIDWELAMVGDPLYDLATHLYLMRYRPEQAEDVKRRWRAAVEMVRPGSSEGWQEDLPRLLAYKRAQSVFTDVIRAALTLDTRPGLSWWPLLHAGHKVQGVLGRAQEALGLPEVPGHWQIMDALRTWSRRDAERERRARAKRADTRV